jgi:tetratricopeptide (TPR) repeat protein
MRKARLITRPTAPLTGVPPRPKLTQVSSDAAPERDITPEQFMRRAEMLADLGRYDEAADELGFAVALDPDNAAAPTLLARVYLAAGRPTEALAAADTAVAAAPSDLDALGARAMALIDLRRYAEAADLADDILRLAPEDADALCVGAAVLAESRNGQRALDAAWRAVELAPDEPRTHLVLGLVAARLELFQLAEKAYREALELDPDLVEARHNIGVIRLEQRRYSEALEELAEAAAMRPAEPRARRSVAYGLRRLLHYGAGYALLAPVLVACAAAGNQALGRVQAVAIGIIGLGMLGVMATRLPGRPMTVLPPLMRADRALAVAVYAVSAGPALVLLFALFGSPWPLAVAVIAGVVALLANAVADHPDR